MPIDSVMQAMAVDYLALLFWFQSEDGRKNRNRPKSLTEVLMGFVQESNVRGFDSAEEFEKAKKKLLGG